METLMKIIKTSKNGINYTTGLLCEKKETKTKAIFWKINRTNPDEGLALKIGRYKNDLWEDIEKAEPKSELTLNHEELSNLIRFISENYQPLKIGAGKYIRADALNDELATQLQDIFSNSTTNAIGDFLLQKNILSNDVTNMIEYCRRKEALVDFKNSLKTAKTESYWQKWFEKNNWILGNEFVRVLDERDIDTKNIADYLMETFDGFVDIVEIKRPNGELKFWSSNTDHGNLVPSHGLVKAITQTQNYIQALEEEINSAKTRERLDGTIIVKPRATLVFGRSNDWDNNERKAFRILNAGYKNLTILTYDQVLARAKRTLNLSNDPSNEL